MKNLEALSSKKSVFMKFYPLKLRNYVEREAEKNVSLQRLGGHQENKGL